MYRRAIRTLFVAATLLLTTTACDKGDAKGGDAKGGDAKGDTKKAAADEGAKVDDGGAKADGGTVAAEAEPEAGTGAGETGGAVAAEADGEAAGAGETGGAVAAEAEGGEEGGAKADDGGGEEGGKDDGDKAKAPKKPESTPKIDGKPLFEKKCKSCHGIDGKGDTTIGKKVDIPSLAKTSMSKSKIVSIIEKGVPDTKMKAYKSKLSKDEIDAVAAYVKKL